MGNAVTNKSNGARAVTPQSSLFNTLPAEWDDLTANVAISFPILGIKGGKWHYRFRGEEAVLLDAQGRFPTPAVHVVILKAQKELSRTYYATGYVEGVNAPPDCWSSDGVAPDPSVAQPINPVCATCRCDAWGSGATPAAPKAKACQQRRRTVVVPYNADLTNEAQGGPILLSVPPGSLANQVAYGNFLRENKVHYAGVVTELSFTQDPSIAFPKIEFNYVKSLTDEEAQVILTMRDHEQVDRILMTKMAPAELDQTPAEDVGPQGPMRTPAPPPQPKATAPAAPRPSVVKPPQATAQPPQPPAMAAPSIKAEGPRVGGFAMAPAATVAKAPPPPPPTGTIASAMQTPAAPPPTKRTVNKVASVPEPEANEAEASDSEEPEATEGKIPSDMNTMFTRLMSA